MRHIWAICIQSLRAALRSRVVLVLLLLLLAVLIGLPLSIKGDGTATGQVQLLLQYTLGLVGFILSLVTLWAGAAAVSREMETRRLDLVVVKPVHRGQIWLGKWLALVVLNAGLVGSCAIVGYFWLYHSLRQMRLEDAAWRQLCEENLVALRVAQPLIPDVREAARADLAARRARGELAADTPDGVLLPLLEKQALATAYAVAPGSNRTWRVDLEQPLDGKTPWFVSFQCSSSDPSGAPIKGRWLLRPVGAGEPRLCEVNMVPAGRHLLRMTELAGAKSLLLTYANQEPTATVFFQPGDGVEVLSVAGSFVGNYARAWLLLYGRLLLLAAFGVMAGSLFSFPVAAFMVFVFFLMLNLSGLLQAFAAPDVLVSAAGWKAQGLSLLRQFYHAIFFLMRPLEDGHALEKLAGGRLIAWSQVAWAWLVQVGLYGVACALLGISVLNRREVGKPE